MVFNGIYVIVVYNLEWFAIDGLDLEAHRTERRTGQEISVEY